MRAHSKRGGEDPAISFTPIEDFDSHQCAFPVPIEQSCPCFKRAGFTKGEIVKREVLRHPLGLSFLSGKKLSCFIGQECQHASLDCAQCVAAVAGGVQADLTLGCVEGFYTQALQDVLFERLLRIAEFGMEGVFASPHLLDAPACLQHRKTQRGHPDGRGFETRCKEVHFDDDGSATLPEHMGSDLKLTFVEW